MKPLSIVFFGISGSGKGTQCDLLEAYVREHDPSRAIVRPDMGVLARTFSETGTSLAEKAKSIMAAGELMPSFIPIYLLAKILNEHFTGVEHVIFDGVARRPAQSIAIDEMMRLWDRTDLHAISLVLSKETARVRLRGRGRYDDADAVIDHRFAWYEANVMPAIETLRSLGWQIHDVDAEPDEQAIHANILALLGFQA